MNRRSRADAQQLSGIGPKADLRTRELVVVTCYDNPHMEIGREA
jgi:hypothetical protein